MPWDRSEQGYYKTVFPQMILWLPDEEAAQYRLEFDNEMERLAEAMGGRINAPL